MYESDQGRAERTGPIADPDPQRAIERILPLDGHDDAGAHTELAEAGGTISIHAARSQGASTPKRTPRPAEHNRSCCASHAADRCTIRAQLVAATACRMSWVAASGCDTKDTCEAGTSTIVAFARSAM